MILIVTSDKDEAGTNIRDHIMKMMEWEDLGNKIWRHKDIIMRDIDDYHLYHDSIDSALLPGDAVMPSAKPLYLSAMKT